MKIRDDHLAEDISTVYYDQRDRTKVLIPTYLLSLIKLWRLTGISKSRRDIILYLSKVLEYSTYVVKRGRIR